MVRATWALLVGAAFAVAPESAATVSTLNARDIAQRLRSVMPRIDGTQGTAPSEGAFTHLERHLDAKNHTGPAWEGQTHAERTAQLRLHFDQRRKRRMRRLQATSTSSASADSSVAAALGPTGLLCDDPLAVNTGQDLPCSYDCEDLRQEYFPAGAMNL